MARRNPMNDRYTKEKEPGSGATRAGASSMKPARSAASSVRQAPKKPTGGNRRTRAMAEANMSKEEKKALRAKQREEENTLYTASSILCNKDPKYKKLRKIWWGLLVAAIVFTALSWATLSTGAGGQVLSIVVLVLAYASIIGALVMDFTVVRKRRNYFRDQVNAMSKRAVERIVEESYQERVAKEAAKKARKEARKEKKSAEEAEAAAKAAYNEVMSASKKKSAERDAAEAAAAAKSGAKGKGKASAASSAAASAKAGEGTTSVKEIAPAGSDAALVAGQASEDTAQDDAAAEEARKAAAAKIAREFAASKGR